MSKQNDENTFSELGENYPQRLLYTKDKNKSESTVIIWIRFMILAVVNVVILASIGAYFQDQRISLMDLISIIANSTGIVLGMLGIWFFFQSERLNRDTEINISKITSTVDELRSQMWDMINKTFTTFIKQEGEEDLEDMRQTIDNLRNQLEAQDQDVTPQIFDNLDLLNNRLNSLESKQANLPPLRYKSSSDTIRDIEIESLIYVLSKLSYPLKASRAYKEIKNQFNIRGRGSEDINYLVDIGFLKLADDQGEVELLSGGLIPGSAIVDKGKILL